MTFAVEPNTKPNRALVRAVKKHDAQGVRAALAAGADPNIYLTSWYKPVVAQVADWIHRRKEAGQPDEGLEAVVLALVDGGVDLTHLWPTQANRAWTSAIHHVGVRAHPVLGPLAIAQARRAWPLALREDQIKSFFQALTGDTATDESLRDVLVEAAATKLKQDEWLNLALASYSPVLLQYCHRRGMPATKLEIFRQLQFDQVQAAPLAWWLEQLPVDDRADILAGHAGRGDGPGRGDGLLALAEIKTREPVREVLWKQALACPATLEAMERRSGLAAYLILAVRQTGQAACGFLAHAKARGLDVGAVRGSSAWEAFPGTFQKNAFQVIDRYPPREANLLSCHLHWHNSNVSVSLCKKLMASGVEPAFEDLCRLAAAMTYSTTERKLTGLFRNWIQGGIDPAPVGQPPAWSHVHDRQVGLIGARLEAWYRSWKLEGTLSQAGPAVPGARGRMRM